MGMLLGTIILGNRLIRIGRIGMRKASSKFKTGLDTDGTFTDIVMSAGDKISTNKILAPPPQDPVLSALQDTHQILF